MKIHFLNVIPNVTNTKTKNFFQDKFIIIFSKDLRMKLNSEIITFHFFFISEHTQIILNKITYIDIIIIYNSVKSCLQIQYKMNCPENVKSFSSKIDTFLHS